MSISSEGTSTITISAALHQLSIGNESLPQDPIDLLTAILSISIDHEVRKADIAIGDYSLKRHEFARIHLWRLNTTDMEKCIALRRGDIARFSGVSIKKAYTKTDPSTNAELVSQQMPTQDTHTAKHLTCLCDFHYSFHNPSIGACFGKVATGFGRHIIMEANLNRSLLTPKSLLDRVGHWFRENHGEFCHQEEHRSDEHCRRAIHELNAPKLLSDIVVRVLQIDIDGAWQNKQYWKRDGNVTSIRVILIDARGVENEEDSMPLFIASNNPLLEQIRKHFRKRNAFLLRQVLTERSNSSRMVSTGDGILSGIFLVPTTKSTIEVVSSFSPPNSSNIAKRLRCSTDVANTSLSPMSADASDKNSPSPQQAIRFKIVSPLVSICFEDLHTVFTSDFKWASNSDLSLTTVGEDGEVHYRNARIMIHAKEGCALVHQEVFADADTISTLCGSCDPSQLCENKQTKEKASNLIIGLLNLIVPLEWILCRDNGTGTIRIEAVSLPSLDF